MTRSGYGTPNLRVAFLWALRILPEAVNRLRYVTHESALADCRRSFSSHSMGRNCPGIPFRTPRFR